MNKDQRYLGKREKGCHTISDTFLKEFRPFTSLKSLILIVFLKLWLNSYKDKYVKLVMLSMRELII